MVNFANLMTPEQKERARQREVDEKKRTVGKIVTVDTVGNTFEKTIMLRVSPLNKKIIISFGGYCEYYLDETYQHILVRKDDAERFVIDIGGRNHKGHQVSLSIDEVLEIFGKGRQLRDKLQKEGYFDD